MPSFLLRCCRQLTQMVPFVTALTVILQHSSRCWTVPQNKSMSNVISRRVSPLSIWNCSSMGAVLISVVVELRRQIRPSSITLSLRGANARQSLAMTTRHYRILPRAFVSYNLPTFLAHKKPIVHLTYKQDQFPKRVKMLNCCGSALQPMCFETHARDHQSPLVLSSTAQKFQRFQSL